MSAEKKRIHKEYMKNYYRRKNNNPEYRKKRNDKRRKYQRKVRMKVLELLGGKCIRCGESDWRCLQIDHVKGDGHSYRSMRQHLDTSSVHLYHKIIKEIQSGSKDYQCLCANCNWRKKYENNEVGKVVMS